MKGPRCSGAVLSRGPGGGRMMHRVLNVDCLGLFMSCDLLGMGCFSCL